MVDIINAMKYLKEGKKIRRHTWNNFAYLRLINDEIINNNGQEVKFTNINPLIATDWELFKEESCEEKAFKKVYELFESIEKLVKKSKEELEWEYKKH